VLGNANTSLQIAMMSTSLFETARHLSGDLISDAIASLLTLDVARILICRKFLSPIAGELKLLSLKSSFAFSRSQCRSRNLTSTATNALFYRSK